MIMVRHDDHLYVGRTKDDGVRWVRFKTLPAYPPKVDCPEFDGEEVVFDITFTPESWSSLVADMCHPSMKVRAWSRAFEFHMGRQW